MNAADRSPAAVARIYREARSRELNAQAERAVGHPVRAAANFRAFAPWWIASAMWKVVVPVVGWGMLVRDWMQMRRVDGIGMLAVDDESLYAIGQGAFESAVVAPELLHAWPLAEVEFVGVDTAGTDHRITFRTRVEEKEYRLYCSSLRTNPWASEVVRRMGGTPPEPIAVAEDDGAYEEPTTL